MPLLGDRTAPQEGRNPARSSGLSPGHLPGSGARSLDTLGSSRLCSRPPRLLGSGETLTCIFTAITTEMSSFSSSLKTTSFFKVRLHNLQGHRCPQQ